MELDDGIAEAHYALGMCEFFFGWNLDAAASEFELAIELDQSMAPAHVWLSCTYAVMGRNAEITAEAERSQKLEPISPIINAVAGLIIFSTSQTAWDGTCWVNALVSVPQFPCHIVHFRRSTVFGQLSQHQDMSLPKPQLPATLRIVLIQSAPTRSVTVSRAHFLPTPISRGHIMGMAAPVYYSAEMVRNIPDDGKRYETVRGELLVTPAPRAMHQRIVLRLARVLADYVDEYGGGEVFISPADISWGPDTLVQPDVFVVDLAEARTGEWSMMRNLMLVVEVLSPGTTRQDRFAKRRLYQEVGVPLYWIVDPEQNVVEVWTPEAQFPTIERERIVWTQESAAEACVLDLEQLFKPI